jgi:hypothetical protein
MSKKLCLSPVDGRQHISHKIIRPQSTRGRINNNTILKFPKLQGFLEFVLP